MIGSQWTLDTCEEEKKNTFDFWQVEKMYLSVTAFCICVNNIWKKRLLWQLKIDEIQHMCYGKGEKGRQVTEDWVPSMTEGALGARAADLTWRGIPERQKPGE